MSDLNASGATPEPKPLSAVDQEFLRDCRALSLVEGYADGSTTARIWFITAEQAQQIADLLGPAEQTTLIPAGSSSELASIVEGLPSFEN